MRVHKYQPKVIGWCQWRTERAQKMAFERGFWTTGSKIECLLCSGSGLSCSPFERQVWATYSHWSTTASELFDLIFCAVTNLAVIVGIKLIPDIELVELPSPKPTYTSAAVGLQSGPDLVKSYFWN